MLWGVTFGKSWPTLSAGYCSLNSVILIQTMQSWRALNVAADWLIFHWNNYPTLQCLFHPWIIKIEDFFETNTFLDVSWMCFPETLEACWCDSLAWVEFFLGRPASVWLPKLGNPVKHPIDTKKQQSYTKSSASGAEGKRFKKLWLLWLNAATLCCSFMLWFKILTGLLVLSDTGKLQQHSCSAI